MDLKRRQYLEAQLSAYLDDELTAAERAEVEQFLAADSDARKLLAELEATVAGLRALPRAKVSPDLMEGLRSRMERRALLGDQPSNMPSAATIPFSGRWLAAAAVVAMMVTTGYVMYSFRSPEPTSRGKDYALVETTVQPGARLNEGETGLPKAPSVLDGQENAKQIAVEGRQDRSGNTADDMTIRPPASLAPAAKPAKSERAITAIPETTGGVSERAAGEALAGVRAQAAQPAQPVTVVADAAADRILDHLAEVKRDKTGSVGSDDKSAKKPAEHAKADLGDAAIGATGGRRAAPSASGSLKGVPAEERPPSRTTTEPSRPAAPQPEMPTMMARAAKGKLESGRALTRGETAAPSTPKIGQAELETKLAELNKKAEPIEQADAIPNRPVGVDSVPGSMANETPTFETKRRVMEVTLDKSGAAGAGGERADSPSRSGQPKDTREGIILEERGGGPIGGAARGFGGMGGFGGNQEGAFGRDRRGGAYREDYDAFSNRGVFREYVDDGRHQEDFLSAAPLLGEPPWRPDETALESLHQSYWWGGFLTGKPMASNLPDVAKADETNAKFGKELGQVTAGATYMTGPGVAKPVDRQSHDRPSSTLGAAGKAATQPASAPATAPASQPVHPPTGQPTQDK